MLVELLCTVLLSAKPPIAPPSRVAERVYQAMAHVHHGAVPPKP